MRQTSTLEPCRRGFCEFEKRKQRAGAQKHCVIPSSRQYISTAARVIHHVSHAATTTKVTLIHNQEPARRVSSAFGIDDFPTSSLRKSALPRSNYWSKSAVLPPSQANSYSQNHQTSKATSLCGEKLGSARTREMIETIYIVRHAVRIKTNVRLHRLCTVLSSTYRSWRRLRY